MTRIDTTSRPQNLEAPPQWENATLHRLSRPKPTSTRQEAEETRFAVDGTSTTTRGDADTAERQHLHASGLVSFLQLLILPTPNRNDISSLSNLRQRWALKMPLHLLVPTTLHSQATSGWMTGLLGAAVDAGRGRGGGNVECGDVKCWPVCGAEPTPHYLATYTKAHRRCGWTSS